MSVLFPRPSTELRHHVDEALANGSAEHVWPSELKREYAKESAKDSLVELEFQTKLGMAIAMGSLAIDVLLIPNLVWLSLTWRVLAVLPIQILGLYFVRSGKIGAAKITTCASLVMFGAMIMHLASYGDAEMQVRYSMAAAFLLAASAVALPLTTLETARYMLSFALATMVAGLWPNPIHVEMLAQHIVMMALIGGGIWGLVRRMREFSARDFLYQLRERHSRMELEENNRLLRELSERDPLTGLPNRRHFKRGFNELIARQNEAMIIEPSSAHSYIALMMIDLDHFKRFNDTHGHIAGDEALRLAGASLSSMISGHEGVCARFGGEEFIVVQCCSSFDEAAELAEAVRQRIAALEIPCGNCNDARITTSIGLAFAPLHQGLEYLDLVELADEALYCAKGGGRNRIEIMTTERETPTVPAAG